MYTVPADQPPPVDSPASGPYATGPRLLGKDVHRPRVATPDTPGHGINEPAPRRDAQATYHAGGAAAGVQDPTAVPTTSQTARPTTRPPGYKTHQ